MSASDLSVLLKDTKAPRVLTKNETGDDQIEQTPLEIKFPLGYLRISDAVGKLERSMFAGLKRAEVVQKIKQVKVNRNASLGYLPRRIMAKEQVFQAALSGKLKIFVLTKSDKEPLAVPADILPIFPLSNGGLSDFVGNLFISKLPGRKEVGLSFSNGFLFVRTSEFEKWLSVEKDKGNWPSQHSKTKDKERGRGRPRLRAHSIDNEILALLNDGRWTGSMGIPALHCILSNLPHVKVPSQDTLSRVLKRLLVVKGEPGLLYPKRRPRRPRKESPYRKK